MKVEFAKNKEQKVWFSEWNIYLDGTYSGFIYKTSRKDSWNIACSRFGLGAVNPIACQKTFSDAKNIVRKFVDEWNENANEIWNSYAIQFTGIHTGK